MKKNKLSEKQPKEIKKYLVYFENGTFNIKYWNGTSFYGMVQPIFWSNVKPVEELKPFYKPTFADYIKKELKARQWSLIDFTVYSGLDSMLIINLLQNKLVVNDFIIEGLIKSFGFTEKYWKTLIKKSNWND